MTKIIDLRGKTPRTNGTHSISQIKNIARHHSATTTGDWEHFWDYWKTKGWGTGGYHEIILRDGSVELCYDPTEITNGIAKHNTGTYHICVVGNGSFTAAQEKTWEERCLLKLKEFGLAVSSVLGHKEFSGASTACPGIDMGMVRNRLLYLSSNPQSFAKPASEDTLKVVEAEEVSQPMTDKLELSTNEGKNAILRVLKRFEKKDKPISDIWRKKVEDGTFTQNDSHELLWVAIDRGYITGNPTE